MGENLEKSNKKLKKPKKFFFVKFEKTKKMKRARKEVGGGGQSIQNETMNQSYKTFLL